MELAGHFEMEEKMKIVFAGEEKHFPPPPDASDLLAFESLEIGGVSPQELRQEKLDLLDLEADDLLAQARRDRLDFGQLGHIAILLAPAKKYIRFLRATSEEERISSRGNSPVFERQIPASFFCS
jgi:hypothetical protein